MPQNGVAGEDAVLIDFDLELSGINIQTHPIERRVFAFGENRNKHPSSLFTRLLALVSVFYHTFSVKLLFKNRRLARVFDERYGDYCSFGSERS